MSERENEQYPIDILVGLAERTIHRLWVIIILLIVLLVASNLGWLYYDSQFETVTTTQEVEQITDGGGDNHFTGGDYYGETEGQNNYDTASP